MFLVGEMGASKHLLLSIKLQDDTGFWHDSQCVVNTGFIGYITMPVSAIEVLGLPFVDETDFVIAGNEISKRRYYKGVVEWHGMSISIPVAEMDGHPNIGMRLLYGSDLHAHLVDGGFATLAKL